MDKGEIIFAITALFLTLAWIIIFKGTGIYYFIMISIYAVIFFLTLGYLDYKKQIKNHIE